MKISIKDCQQLMKQHRWSSDKCKACENSPATCEIRIAWEEKLFDEQSEKFDESKSIIKKRSGKDEEED